MPNGEGIQRETFLNCNEETKWAITYDFLREIRDIMKEYADENKVNLKEHEKRIENMEKRWSKLAGALIILASLPGIFAVLVRIL
jgi:hypothetical protein